MSFIPFLISIYYLPKIKTVVIILVVFTKIGGILVFIHIVGVGITKFQEIISY